MRKNNRLRAMMLPALCLIPLVALLRVLLGWQTDVESTWLLGSTPLAAVALCAGRYLPRRWSLVIPLGILLISDWIIDRHFGESVLNLFTLNRYALLAGIGCLGMWLQAHPRIARPGHILGATVLSSTVFYLVSNALSWPGASGYPQTFAGFVQTLTIGLPGYPPAYIFYRNGLVSDLLYSILFVSCLEGAGAWRKQPAGIAARAGAVVAG